MVLLALAACNTLMPDALDDSTVLDGMVDGLSGSQRAVHIAGDGEFGRRFAVAEGLGPVFVATSCESCHAGDGKGHPVFDITRFGRMGPGGFDPMTAYGGPQLQNRAVLNYVAEQVPNGVTGMSRFTPPAVSGLGFLEAVDDTTILALADSNDTDGDGISGRVQLIGETGLIIEVASLEAVAAEGGPTRGVPIGGRYVGRFGKKALTINLLHQVVNAYHQDMGITSTLIPHEIFNPAAGPFTGDAAPEPEVPSSVVDRVVFYLKTLKAPPRRRAETQDVTEGAALFRQANCSGCHLPDLTTGRSPVPALDRVTFHAYTDLLLHDMGPELDDGYTEGIATTSEWRTAPLWGVGLAADAQGGTPHLLHDGRATSLREAIELHGGEAAGSRSAFQGFTPEEQRKLVAFLESL